MAEIQKEEEDVLILVLMDNQNTAKNILAKRDSLS